VLQILHSTPADYTQVQPWVMLLQIHFRDFPSDTLLTWEGSHSLLQTYLNSLKEAAVICSGNAAAILQMSQQSQQNLWTSVEAADLSAYQRVASSLQISPKAKGSRPAMVPVRLHIQRSSGGECGPTAAFSTAFCFERAMCSSQMQDIERTSFSFDMYDIQFGISVCFFDCQ